jgi:hypothetical protein
MNVLVFAVFATVIFGCGCILLLVVGVGVYLSFKPVNQPRRNKVNINMKAVPNAAPLTVDLTMLERRDDFLPETQWHTNVDGEADVLAGDGIVVTGPIVGFRPRAISHDNPGYGRVEIGWVPGKSWTQWAYREHRSGVMDVAYTFINGQLMLGWFPEPRFLVTDEDGNTLNLAGLPGGFSDPGEDAITAAKRELIEELGGDFDIFELVDENKKPLPSIIPNRAFNADKDGKNANRYFGLYVSSDMLALNPDGTYGLNKNYAPTDPDKSDKSPEANALRKKIANAKAVAKLTFVRWSHLGLLGRDGLVQSGAFRIVSMWDLDLLPKTPKNAICHDIAG